VKRAVFLPALIEGVGSCNSGDQRKQAVALLWRVFILLCTTPSKVHPAEVISVLYPVARGYGSAGEGGSGLKGKP